MGDCPPDASDFQVGSAPAVLHIHIHGMSMEEVSQLSSLSGWDV